MKYPRVIIDLKKLENNIEQIVRVAKREAGCTTLALVTKGHCADAEIVKLIAKNPDVDYLADSRIENIKKYYDALGTSASGKLNGGKKTMMLRIPMQSELADIVKYIDLCQISEIETIKLLNREAASAGKVQDILLMIDMGDLREGLIFTDRERIHEVVSEILKLANISLRGISVNMNCYGAIIPKEDNLSEFVSIARETEEKHGISLDVISGGNSGTIYLAEAGKLPIGITNLRIGEGYLQGTESSYAGNVSGADQDAFVLEAEIVEVQTKPSLPIGESGLDAFGHAPYYEDKGDMKRAIIAVGKQDTELDSMTPLDAKIGIMGGSSDHIIIDITNCDKEYDVGDAVKFRLGYSGMLRAMTSEYVAKTYK
ncbi:MAG: alanine/ornithine racemase family PLP-dependent enzyme [Firmicutes bacterium]|nr:alanine/ornithine racemase family PLP-dependent enzyme [Bacillota bacterium]